jgi:rhamnosyltransferase
MQHTSIDTSILAILTVTFNPDIERLSLQIAALPPDASFIVVDNASAPDAVESLQRLLIARPNTELIRNESNLGLATALNQAANHVIKHLPSAKYLLLMDQDSVPAEGAIASLLAAHIDLEAQGVKVGCVGPRLIDKTTGLQHGFHCIKGWKWVRVFPSEDHQTPIACANLNGSGTLLRTELFRTLGGLDEGLFIDHVDTECAFRTLSCGWKLFGIPWILFDHSMGDRGLRYWWFGWRVWPQRSPLRHYYLFRNTLWLMRRNYVPAVWKIWAVVKLFLTMAVHLIIDPQRCEQFRKMLKGVRDGLSNNGIGNNCHPFRSHYRF